MIRKYRHSFLFLVLLPFFLSIYISSKAQNVAVVFEGLEQKFIPKSNSIDSLLIIELRDKVLTKLRLRGYWLTSCDSIKYQPDSAIYYFYQGDKYDEIYVDLENDKSNVIQSSAINRSGNSILDQIESLINHYENSGYPFASIRVKDAVIKEDDLFLQIEFDPGLYITNDSITISEKGMLKANFLNNYLSIKVNKAYNESLIREIPNKIENLSFVELVDVEQSFQLKQSQLHLEIKPIKVNYFDGFIGFIPRGNTGKVDVTGQVEFSIKNLFQSAKEIDFQWQKMTTNTQQLNLKYYHPIVLNTPLDAFFELNQLKQDTLYSNVDIGGGLAFRPTSSTKMSISFQHKMGNELNDATDQSGDFNLNEYGLGVEWWKLDNKFNPKKGVSVELSLTAGDKTIEDSITTSNNSQFSGQLIFRQYLPISRRSILYSSLDVGSVKGDPLFLNDLYRIGGLRTLRGFNEGEFFASTYALCNFEWRLYFEKNAYFMLLYDQSWIESMLPRGTYYNHPLSFGGGIQLESNFGLFQLIYALGKRKNESLAFENSKIHFGYRALF